MSPAEYMAIMLRKQKHHIGNKCTSSPASMSIFTSNIRPSCPWLMCEEGYHVMPQQAKPKVLVCSGWLPGQLASVGQQLGFAHIRAR